MPSLEYIVGSLDQGVRDLRNEVKALRIDIEEIKLFRAKVMGASVIMSVISSVLFAVGLEMLKIWAK